MRTVYIYIYIYNSVEKSNGTGVNNSAHFVDPKVKL